nr:MAG TPA: hypothetical protein [Caudoviricetes sp.]
MSSFSPKYNQFFRHCHYIQFQTITSIHSRFVYVYTIHDT